MCVWRLVMMDGEFWESFWTIPFQKLDNKKATSDSNLLNRKNYAECFKGGSKAFSTYLQLSTSGVQPHEGKGRAIKLHIAFEA